MDPSNPNLNTPNNTNSVKGQPSSRRKSKQVVSPERKSPDKKSPDKKSPETASIDSNLQNFPLELTIGWVKHVTSERYPIEVYVRVFFKQMLLATTPTIIIRSREKYDLNFEFTFKVKDVNNEMMDSLLSEPFLFVLTKSRNPSLSRSYPAHYAPFTKSAWNRKKRRLIFESRLQPKESSSSINVVPKLRKYRLFDEFVAPLVLGEATLDLLPMLQDVDQILSFLIEESQMRVAVFIGFDTSTAASLKDMRPTPSFNVIFGGEKFVLDTFRQANLNNLIRLNNRWLLVFTDLSQGEIDKTLFTKRTNILTYNTSSCCINDNEDSCDCPEDFNLKNEFMAQIKSSLDTVISQLNNDGFDTSGTPTSCDGPFSSPPKNNSLFETKLLAETSDSNWALSYDVENGIVRPNIGLVFKSETANESRILGSWKMGSGFKKRSYIQPVKRFFRVATGYAIPFAYPLLDDNNKKVLNPDGSEIWDGYCIELIDRLAHDMNFEYELVTSYDYGRKYPNGSWSGLVGELQRGRVDMIVAALTMTSEREEVIDFVAPYFEQTGFSIVIRKPLRKTSLFKFMTVLRVEVWFSILAALCLTAIMIWFLDKYSPYSARNNKEKYPYPCREFSLRESFWFAVTSFTPQGGGEAPKSLSARTLVAAYWLFVVLMLATFTANLAAFLTVERMQSPVQSLKQLARQSRINYTVVQDSDAHSYFRNMKFAEETLYRVWKEITLNSSVDQSKYRVWDYPIKEQFGHILIAIEKTGTVATPEEGFEKVKENENAEFALIHDALEIKYEVYRNCNLTEIGEPFAEQPYAIAVQQGSHLNEEISRRILDLQRDRYFETLSAKYWNVTKKGKCDSFDEDEGITLESLGGVFIATLFGLLLAMLTLGAEVIYQKKKEKNKIKVKDDFTINKMIRDEIITSREFGHTTVKKKTSLLNPKPTVNFITVHPKDQLF